jgi:hypothetical protein
MLNGGLLFLAFILTVINYRIISRLPILQMIALGLIFSIAVGVHGLSHSRLEQAYGYNPLKIFGF